MSEMNWMICNKCFAPLYRGKRPYHMTQCGHISCQNCLQQVEQQCPQCQHGTISLPLQEEPLMPELIPYFQPFAEILEKQLKVIKFRGNQMKILMRRFIELIQRIFKRLTDKYTSVKNEKDKLEKRLMICQMHRITPRSAYRGSMPSNLPIAAAATSKSGYSMESLDRIKSTPITPMDMESIDGNRKEYRTADGFRIPFNRKPPRSMDSQNMLS